MLYIQSSGWRYCKKHGWRLVATQSLTCGPDKALRANMIGIGNVTALGQFQLEN
jgi:hypothetical protein